MMNVATLTNNNNVRWSTKLNEKAGTEVADVDKSEQRLLYLQLLAQQDAASLDEETKFVNVLKAAYQQ